ncbi:transglycosylase family protein [Saccharopolyspora cebuensis]|uniref:transglycosylase family protein n=1 Tax=Saccharopolyspora cebuensis TaxID=418759 RepID=UPI003383F194
MIPRVRRSAAAAALLVCAGTATATTAQAQAPAPDRVWDRLAECESGGRWALDSGNGYYGGLQFSRGTWSAYGGAEHAHYPHRATRQQQIAIAERLLGAEGGYGAWPACARELGLPR